MSNYSLKSPETSQEWEDYLLFRWEILRKPLGMSQESLADSIEEESFHVMGIDSQNEVIASGSCLLYTSPSPRDRQKSRMPSSA